jgi:UDP-N-acetyl-D-mannosaminuronate dehydrogenase
MSVCVGIVGQGYVGLPMAIAAAASGFEVIGIDTDEKKVATIMSGRSTIEDLSDLEIKTQIGRGKYTQFCKNYFSVCTYSFVNK